MIHKRSSTRRHRKFPRRRACPLGLPTGPALRGLPTGLTHRARPPRKRWHAARGGGTQGNRTSGRPKPPFPTRSAATLMPRPHGTRFSGEEAIIFLSYQQATRPPCQKGSRRRKEKEEVKEDELDFLMRVRFSLVHIVRLVTSWSVLS